MAEPPPLRLLRRIALMNDVGGEKHELYLEFLCCLHAVFLVDYRVNVIASHWGGGKEQLLTLTEDQGPLAGMEVKGNGKSAQPNYNR